MKIVRLIKLHFVISLVACVILIASLVVYYNYLVASLVVYYNYLVASLVVVFYLFASLVVYVLLGCIARRLFY